MNLSSVLIGLLTALELTDAFKEKIMKRILCIGLLLATVAFTSFADEIRPELLDYGNGFIQGDAVIVSVFPNTQEAVDKLLKLRQGQMNKVVSERVIGPTKNRITSSTRDAHTLQGMAMLAAKLRSYARGEFYSILHNEEEASRMASQLATTIIFAETLQDAREELSLTYSTLNGDGTRGSMECFFITAEKAPLDAAIKETASSANSSGKYRAEGSSSVPSKPSVADTSTTDLVESVKALLASNETIVRFKEENKKLLSGFEE